MFEIPETPRQRTLRRWGSLKKERDSWVPHWRDIAEQFAPRQARFLLSETNQGTKKHGNIVNNVGPWALRTLAAGMMSGLTSPARPWFKLTTSDPGLAKSEAVRVWLDQVADVLRLIFARSNIYLALHSLYGHLGGFGTAVSLLEEDATDIVRAYSVPVGQYALANSDRMHVDTLHRELRLTVLQTVRKFGLKQCSLRVQQAFGRREFDRPVDVVHAIEPRENLAPGRLGPKNMPWASCWYELGADQAGKEAAALLESGYEEFPALCPRWDVTGQDVYGSAPTMEALGDARAIQLYERRKAQAVDRIVNPPMRAPMSLQGGRASLVPGDTTFVDTVTNGQTFEPVLNLPPAVVGIIGEETRQYAERIKSTMYADLWLLLAQGQDNPQKTATEVAELHEEKMLQLGPVVDRITGEGLNPLIKRTFGIARRRGMIPPPPDELAGQDVSVEYISVLAQAQKLIGLSGMERLNAFVTAVGAAKPEVLDKIDADELVEQYADALGVPASVMVADDKVQAIRAERAQRQQAQEMGAAAAQAAKSAQALSQTETTGTNALAAMLNGGLGQGGGG